MSAPQQLHALGQRRRRLRNPRSAAARIALHFPRQRQHAPGCTTSQQSYQTCSLLHCIRRDSFSIDSLYLANGTTAEARTACTGKPPLELPQLEAAGLALGDVACAFQNYDRESSRNRAAAARLGGCWVYYCRETGGLRDWATTWEV